ncbi:MAG: DEAD/DEAH box helicase [Desulfobacteraceae bacterium]|nr:DEAD/DEAH box helicase [Desulfobacteraceae bacterium]
MKLFNRKKKSLLGKTYTSEGIRFTFSEEDPPVFPLNKNDSEILSKLLPEGNVWAALDNLWSDNFLQDAGPDSWIVPYSIYEKNDLDEDTDLFNTLGLPFPEPLDIEVNTVSYVGDPGFRINAEAFHPNHGPLRDSDYPRYGSVFLLGKDVIAPITRDRQKLFDAARGENVQWDNLEERMSYLARTKNAALAAGAKLDGYLTNEDYEFKSEAKIDFREESADEITLIPKVEGMEDYGVEDGEELLKGSPPKVLTKAVSKQRRKRLVLDESLRSNLESLPENGKIRGSDVPRFLTNPEQIVPEGFDLSLFSERVKGIKTKVYNSRPYIHVNRSKGGWFEGVPGIELEDWSPAEAIDEKKDADHLSGLNNLSLETYRELVRRAKEASDEYINYKGSWIRIDEEVGDRFEKALDPLSIGENGTYQIPVGSILEIYENIDLLEFIDRKSLVADDTQLPDDLPEVAVPNSFNGKLYPYQLGGYRWLNRLSGHRIGGLLADEMGLGKTIQAIAHLLFLKEEEGSDPHLIVVPKTLMENWQREIDKFSQGTINTYAYDGPGRIFSPDLFKQIDVVLTTYDTLRRDQAKLGTVGWNMVICDEAQFVKNPTAQRTSAVKALKAKHRVALTGTPVENGLIEFWCIMDFVQPGLLGSWVDFRRKYEHPIVEGDEEEREEHVQELLKEIKGYYLRRLKSEYMKNLPQKNFEYREVALSDEQFNIYKEIAHRGKIGGKGAALAAIQKLLIISAHPLAQTDDYRSVSDVFKHACPKLEETLGIIENVKNASEKVIIFTDFKRVQRILQQAIRQRFEIWPDIINGEISRNRQLIIDIFSEKKGFNVIILGHQVAGIGLNITAANHVIHYTRPWNPAKENQASDRVHRIGQTKPVTIYYPFVKDQKFVTVEERLDELIRSKEDLARDVLRPSAESKVKAEDLLDCLKMPEK